MNNEWKKYMHEGLDINFPTHLRKKEVKNEINNILSNKKLIKSIVNNYRKKKNLGWLTLKFYDESGNEVSRPADFPTDEQIRTAKTDWSSTWLLKTQVSHKADPHIGKAMTCFKVSIQSPGLGSLDRS